MPASTANDKLTDIGAVKKRFLAINRDRLERTRAALRERQRDFFDLLPLLFHANHPMLPGFVSKQTPVGVSDYSPGKRTLDVARRLVRSFDYKRRALPTYDIHAIYVMGSIGTIAYSDKSDFDIWLVHRTGISEAQRGELCQKAREIEKLAAQLDLEVHFFVMDTASFTDGSHDDLSTESSGTAQHCLLLEEFYRTGLLVAGRYPAWWLVPPEHEADYADYVRDLLHRRFIREDECLDFGAVPTIPAEEFFGAALWQLSKSIDSPYKSVLKLMLMEIYAQEHPRIELLCHRFKRDIYRGESDLNQLDPYLALYRRIEAYLAQAGDAGRLELVRRCFYFKVNERLSTPDNPRLRTWQRELLMELVAGWGWDARHLAMLDARGQWKIDRVADERRTLVEQLTASYRLLSNFARENSQISLISQQDLNVLGRKLYAAFERKAGKIEVLNRGISGDLWEAHLHIQQSAARSEGENWLLHRGGGPGPDSAAPAVLLKRGRGAAELLAWSYFNGLVDGASLITLNTADSGVTVKELRDVLRCLQRHFDLQGLAAQQVHDLLAPPRVRAAVMFVNVGVDPLLAHTREGKHLTTFRTDALSYGGLGENLALTFDQVIATSWNEVLTYRFTGPDALMEALCNYLQWNPPDAGGQPLPFHAYSFSSSRGASIAQRLEELFSDIVTAYNHSQQAQAFRYVLMVKHHYYVLFMQDGKFGFQRLGSQDELLRYLGAPRGAFAPTVIDRHALTDTPLPLVCASNQPGAVQLYYQLDGGRASVYVSDEHGSLFTHSLSYINAGVLVRQYTRFLSGVHRRQALKRDMRQEPGSAPYELRCYQLKKGGQRRWRLDRQAPADGPVGPGFFDVQVSGELGADDKPVFTFYCDGREFSTLEHGANLYEEVARHILARRAGGTPYPLYITDIDIPPRLHGGDSGAPLQTIHYLNYKKLIEERLNQAVERLAGQAVA